ncbi:Trs120-domain-containing protein [Lichtheimia hyalospora FSU 10163]|nr:Trs120-domain-containing protein [Lichtheimia hyalospora FSU 10163]
MDLAINITSSCRVRVLLVPVPPIKSSTFWKHVELVKKFSVVRLGDVTPDLQNGAGAMFSSQVFQEGQMHFQFTTTYTRDHAHLEDFQPHRRIFGVIGIMDCQEWKDKDLSEGHKHFVDTLHKYPTAIVSRCFAFDPTETQPDDTKGLIMIPNVGNMSFYMSTMICDFASEILSQFAMLASRIENLPTLESPLPRAYYITPRFDTPSNVSPTPSVSTPGSPNMNHRTSQPPKPTQSSSSSLLKRASTPVGNARPLSFAQHQQKLTPNHGPMSPPLPSPQPTRSTGNQGDNGKTKRRTPARVKKLLADLYLLAGRLPDAVNHYTQAIEMTKTTSDYLWLGSAMEGLTCATLLLGYLHADVGHIVSRSQSAPGGSTPETPSTPTTDASPSTLLDDTTSTVAQVLQRYTTLLDYYDKVSTTSNIPMPTLIYAETLVKMARFMLTVYANKGWSDHTLSLLVQGKLSSQDNGILTGPQRFISIEDMMRCKESGIPRRDIAEWATKIWVAQLDDLSLLDQINLMTHMSSVLNAIGYHRKSAWLMYESVNRMLPLLIQGRATLASSRDTTKKDFGKSDDGILEILKRICEVYGLGERNVHDGGTLDALQGQDDGSDKNVGDGVRGAVAKEPLHFGWPKLQIDILRQCIAIAEALPDYGAVLYYTTVLLKNLYQYISKEEQIRLATSIQRIVAMGKRVRQVESNVNYWGVNIVSAVEALLPIPRKAVYQHSVKGRVSPAAAAAANGDPFIYNPFSQKRNEKQSVILVKNELCDFRVTLTNPFGFDLELQNVVLSTTGVPFNAVSATATIPANGTLNLRLTGTPEETGTLVVRGCMIKIVGFAEQEFLVDYGQKQKKEAAKDPKNKRDDSNNKSEFIKLKHSGLSAIQSSRKRETSNELRPVQFYELSVIEDQPLLKIKSTSLLHDAVMLYEGEMTHISIELENIGNIPVDFASLSFVDSTTANPLPVNPELPVEEQYEIELYTKGMHVFSWEGSKEEMAQFVGKKIWLPPGDLWKLNVNVYGKRGCTGGTIQIDYGYLKRDENEAASFYTRQLYLPVLITVYQNLEPLNWDILYLRHSAPVPKADIDNARERIAKIGLEHNNAYDQPIEDLLLITRQFDDQKSKNDYCLVTLDVRNTWTVPFDTKLVIDNGEDDKLTSIVTLQPGSTKRITLPVKRLFLDPEECYQPVPSLEPNKQFVVSQGPKIPLEQERARLQTFWYRETLLRRITATWHCNSTGRHGLLNIRSSLRLLPMQLSILKKEDIEFIVEMTSDHAKKVSHRRFECKSNEFVTMNVSIRNRNVHPIKLILRVQPVQSYDDGAKEYDLTGKLLIQGLQQVVLPEVPPNDGITTHQLPMCFLSRGQFEFLYHAEDVHTQHVYYDHEWAIVDVHDN